MADDAPRSPAEGAGPRAPRVRLWPLDRVAAILIAGVAVVGVALALQGWRSKAPAFDMVPYFRSAADLLRHGVLPSAGDISSYGSFSPPGTAWLMAPGMALLDDPRLYEKLGSGALHAGTLVGIFLLAHLTLGRRAAYVAVLVYGFSALGLNFAGSLWPIGHPFFAVWTVYFIARWGIDRRPGDLARATTVGAVGLYQDLAIAPLALVVPVVWLLYRPPVAARPLLAAAVVAAIVWAPYMRFEAERGFVDLTSLLLRRDIAPVDFRAAWCNRAVVLVDHGQAGSAPAGDTGTIAGAGPGPPDRTIAERLRARLSVAVNGLLANFDETTRVPGLPIVLLCLVIAAMAAELARTIGTRRRLRTLKLPPGSDGVSDRSLAAHPGELALIGLVVPWLVLLAVAEPDRPERFFWLWPLQVVWLAAFVARLLPNVVRRDLVTWLATSLVVVLIAAGPVRARVDAWRTTGWAGEDPPEMAVVDALAADILASGRTHAAIGYQTYIFGFMPRYHIIDPHYKVGAEFDLLLEQRYGIVNDDQCAEGVAEGDEYRVVQTRPRPGAGEPAEAFDVRLGDDFRSLGRFGLFEVLRRP